MKKPNIFARFSMFWITILLGLVYWAPSLVFYDELIGPMKQGTYSAALVVMAVVFITWLPSAIKAYWKNEADGPNLLILAVFLTSFVFLQTAVFRFMNLQLDRPDWLYYSPIGGFISYQIVVLGTLITVAVAKTSGVHIDNFKRRLGWAIFISGTTLGVFIGASLGKAINL